MLKPDTALNCVDDRCYVSSLNLLWQCKWCGLASCMWHFDLLSWKYFWDPCSDASLTLNYIAIHSSLWCSFVSPPTPTPTPPTSVYIRVIIDLKFKKQPGLNILSFYRASLFDLQSNLPWWVQKVEATGVFVWIFTTPTIVFGIKLTKCRIEVGSQSICKRETMWLPLHTSGSWAMTKTNWTSSTRLICKTRDHSTH